MSMSDKPLDGKRMRLSSSTSSSEVIAAYQSCFAMLGATVDVISRIYYGDYKPGYSSWKTPVSTATWTLTTNSPGKVQSGFRSPTVMM